MTQQANGMQSGMFRNLCALFWRTQNSGTIFQNSEKNFLRKVRDQTIISSSRVFQFKKFKQAESAKKKYFLLQTAFNAFHQLIANDCFVMPRSNFDVYLQPYRFLQSISMWQHRKKMKSIFYTVLVIFITIKVITIFKTNLNNFKTVKYHFFSRS